MDSYRILSVDTGDGQMIIDSLEECGRAAIAKVKLNPDIDDQLPVCKEHLSSIIDHENKILERSKGKGK